MDKQNQAHGDQIVESQLSADQLSEDQLTTIAGGGSPTIDIDRFAPLDNQTVSHGPVGNAEPHVNPGDEQR